MDFQRILDPDSGIGTKLGWQVENSILTIQIRYDSGSTDIPDYDNNQPWSQYISTIEKIIIKNGVTSIGEYVFSEHYNLINVTIPNSITIIKNNAFSMCSNLISITIPNGVTTIENGAFSICTSLNRIKISNSVTTIKNGAFEYCSQLDKVYYTGTEQEWENINIGNNNEALTNAIIFYNQVADNHKILHSRMKQKSDTYSNWELATNFVPLDGEIIVFTPDNNQDTRGTRIKIGDGETNVNTLSFALSLGESGTGTSAEIFNDYENNIASGAYSHAEGTSSIKPFNYIDYKTEDPFDPYVRPYGTIDDWVNNEGLSLINNFNYKNKTFDLPNLSIIIYPSITAQRDVVGANNFKASDFPNHRFMLGDGYNKEIKEAKESNYTNWIYVFDDPESNKVYLRAEDNINGSQTITWNSNAPVEAPYVFIDHFNTAAGKESHIEGAGNLVLGERGHIEGRHNEIKASSNNSHVEGFGNIVGNKNSAHIEGERNLTISTGTGIHIEGRANVAQGTYSHIEGRNNFAFGAYSHVGGYGTRYPFTVDEKTEKTTTSAIDTSFITINLPVDEANTSNSIPAPNSSTSVLHWGIWYINKTRAIARRVGKMYKQNNKLYFAIRTIGNTGETITIDPTDDTYFYWGNAAMGTGTFVTGKESYAYGDYSTAIGQGAVARGIGQIALGKNNSIDDTSLLIIGNGTDVLHRSNALTLNSNGDLNITGNLTTKGKTIQIVQSLPASPDSNTLYIVTG